MKNKTVYILVLVSIAAFLVIKVLIDRENRTETNYKIGYARVIYKMQKASRKYDDIFVTNGLSCRLLKDLARRDTGYDLQIGDSVIKPANSSCFIYKRVDRIIFKACNLGYSIYFSDEEIGCTAGK